jgi:hypothetical protein
MRKYFEVKMLEKIRVGFVLQKKGKKWGINGGKQRRKRGFSAGTEAEGDRIQETGGRRRTRLAEAWLVSSPSPSLLWPRRGNKPRGKIGER